MQDLDMVTLARRLDRANLLLLVVVVVAAVSVCIAGATFAGNHNRDREAARRHDEAQDIAIVAALKYVASDHPDKDSVKLLERIAAELESYRKENNAKPTPDLHLEPSNRSR